MAVRVGIVESQALFAAALASIVTAEPAFTLVLEARNPEPAALAAGGLDLIVIDVDGCAGDLERLLATCREAAPAARLCVLTMRLSTVLSQRCLDAGCEGFIIKDLAPAAFAAALRAIAEGRPYVDPRIAVGSARRRGHGATKPSVTELSLRENEVLKLIAEGLANKQISARLRLSEKTVKNHVSRIFAKLNITARTQAAVHAIRAGIV